MIVRGCGLASGGGASKVSRVGGGFFGAPGAGADKTLCFVFLCGIRDKECVAVWEGGTQRANICSCCPCGGGGGGGDE